MKRDYTLAYLAYLAREATDEPNRLGRPPDPHSYHDGDAVLSEQQAEQKRKRVDEHLRAICAARSRSS